MVTLDEVFRRWPDQGDAVAYFEAIRWPAGPVCPYCASTKASRKMESVGSLSAKRWQCQSCAKSFTALVGTPFARTHVDLRKWILLLHAMRDAPDLSSVGAARLLAARQATVWAMMRRIKAVTGDDAALLDALVAGESTVGTAAAADQH